MPDASEIRILLVDDEPSTHFLHKRIIRKAVPAASAISVMNGQEALEYILATRADNPTHCPTHIWLDLQMPHVDGWSFLEAYLALEHHSRCNPSIAIVTSSPNPEDKVRALSIPSVVAYVEKFVTPEECRRILNVNS